MSQNDDQETEQAPELERFVVLLRHLLAGCPDCTALVPSPPAPAEAHDPPLPRAKSALPSVVARESAERLLAELQAVPAEQRELLVRNVRRFASVELAELLAERSVAEARKGPRGAWLAARAAVAVAEGAARAPSTNRKAAHDALARAWSVLGNAHRLRSEVPEAEAAFAAALGFLQRGSGGPAPRAWYCQGLASLRIFRREFAEARALALEAVAAYRVLGDARGEAAAEILVALVSSYAGEQEAAFQPLNRSIELAKACGDENLCRLAISNLVRCHIELGQVREAHALFLAAGAFYELCQEEIVALKWRWTEALIERDLGLLDAAAGHLVEVREGLLKCGLRVEIADVSLDLIDVYKRLGNGAAILQAAGETIPIYQAVGATRELLATLIVLTKAAH